MFKVKETRREAPVRLLVHGPGGVGKSTLGASAPGAIFIAAEDGLANIDARAVEPAPQSWAAVLGALDWMTADPPGTVVIDSLDWLEPLCWRHVCEAAKKSDIEAFGYGKGYIAAWSEWRVLVNKLSALHERGSRIVLIAHSVRKMVKNPDGEDYEAWQIKLHEKATGLFVEWVDVVGFAAHETVTVETAAGSNRHKGLSTGKRILRCGPSAAFACKTRFTMPRSIPLDWSAFDRAVQIGRKSPIAQLRVQLEERLKELADAEMSAKCTAFLQERGETVASLSEALETVNTYAAERRKAG